VDALNLLKNENRAVAPLVQHILAKIGYIGMEDD